MFPIIPQYYTEEKPIAKQKPPARIFAATIVHPNCCTEDFPIERLFDDSDYSPTEEIKIRAEENGTIRCSTPSWFWITKINLADDCHSSNIRLCRNSSLTLLKLECIKKIQQFEELALWFSHELLAHLQIPFLIPGNIQGEKQYVCHKCGYQYEMPNPLKIHLALNCRTQSQQELWNRLRNLNECRQLKDVITLPNQNTIFAFQLTAEKNNETDIIYQNRLKYPACSISSNNNNNNNNNIVKNNNNDRKNENDRANETDEKNDDATRIAQSHIIGGNNANRKNKSAFKPYVKYRTNVCDNETKSPTSSTDSETTHYHRKNLIGKSISPHDNSVICSIVPPINNSNRSDATSKLSDQESLLNKQAAEMESIMSNLGKIKNGHLCIYCGKMYSRKYGLKIHIRTHTGFKPLKCKYCMRPFGDPSNLNKHVRLHSEADTPYKCDHCGKILVRKRDLDRHMKSRHQCEEIKIIH